MTPSANSGRWVSQRSLGRLWLTLVTGTRKQTEDIVADKHTPAVIRPDSGLGKGRDPRPGWDKGLCAVMRRVIESVHGKAIDRRRMATVEPVLGQMKFKRGFDRFRRRGRSTARSEWRLAAATHNRLKLHNHQKAAAAA